VKSNAIFLEYHCDPPRWQSGSRVMTPMQILQTPASHMGVDLRCREIAVTEQQLHDSEIGTVVDQVRGKCMPKRVWRYGTANSRHKRIATNSLPERLSAHA
jgi:hypothetical protein